MKKITLKTENVTKELGDLYGLFFEDINHAADGGLYAELVQNRSFEYDEIDRKEYHPLWAWEKSDNLEWKVDTKLSLNQENTHYLYVSAKRDSFIRNFGYNSGIPVKTEEKYDFSVFARACDNTAKADIKVSVETEDGQVCMAGCISVDGSEWKKYELVLKAENTTNNGRLYLRFDSECTLAVDMVSLFPEDTYKGRKNGLRKDIAEALADMKPKFLRFPGGCLTHDGNLNDHARNSMYRWKRTLGKVEERPSWRNNWGYNQTLGLGYYEYFCFCEDIGAKPLPVLPGGFNPHKGEGVPIEELQPWVDEALDLIEFANGDKTTVWGGIRARMGHEEPFGLEYIGIGNEEIGDGFFERYPYFHKAIREKYPDIKIINTAGPFAVGEGYEAGWSSAKQYGSDLIDEHYYSSPEWFLANMHHYDDYDDKGTKVFLGEYASWGNTYYNAIVEAAYMTHLEKAKGVALACYAPMLCNVDYVNWQPDMLWFDNHRIMKTPNYYVQKLFMEHQGTQEIEAETEGLDEIISLVDDKNISGDISITGNDIAGEIFDISFTDVVTGDVKNIDGFKVDTTNQRNLICNTESEKYVLEFGFRRTEGRKGLKIMFGQKKESDFILWEFGGWDNWDCNISSTRGFRGSTISHRIFHVEDIEYKLRLEVDGRRIRTYVNGVLWNDTTDRLPELEELYVAASKDEATGEVILKVVNLTGEEKVVDIASGMENAAKSVVCTSLKGYSLTEVNSLDEPDKIAPVEEKLATDEDGNFKYGFAPHSVNVFVIK